MARLVHIGREALGRVVPLARSLAATAVPDRAFDDVEAYSMFVGYPRSGHTILGALLDAHPNAVVANGLDVVKYIHLGLGRRQVFHLLRERAREVARDGCRSGDYTYAVPGQWQGRHDRLLVIGDKKGMGTTMRIRKRPWLLDRLRKTVGVPVKAIHVIRNPYDDIATMLRRARQYRPGATLRENVDLYFAMSDTAAAILARFDGGDVLTLCWGVLSAERLRLGHVVLTKRTSPRNDTQHSALSTPQHSRHPIPPLVSYLDAFGECAAMGPASSQRPAPMPMSVSACPIGAPLASRYT
jgi:hypothetical protein